MSCSLVNLPRLLWDWYIEYLWDYERGSWVYSSAKSFRIMAWLVVVPFALFIMLDVASYIIARTLGVIDDTKASTSDHASILQDDNNNNNKNNNDNNKDNRSSGGGGDDSNNSPSIVVQPDPSSIPIPHRAGDSSSLEDLVLHLGEPQAFGEGNLKLSGVGVFSPAVSCPPSPVVERKFPSRSLVESEVEGEDEGEESESAKGGLGREPSWGSFSVESSFTMIDKDSGSEDAGLGIKRRPNRDGITITPMDS